MGFALLRFAVVALAMGCNTRPLSSGDAGRVQCGSQSCDLEAGSFCCDDYVHGPLCVTSCPVGDSLSCDGPEDCPMGQRCCGGFAAGGSSSSSCMPVERQCQAEIFCHDDSACPSGTRCGPLGPIYPGVMQCQ